jgi:hypothetical protein
MSVSADVEAGEPLLIAGGDVSGAATEGRSWATPSMCLS